MACAGTAVLLHLQKFWIIEAESNDLLALAPHFKRPGGAKLALDRCFGRPNGAKLALEWRFGRPGGAKLALERRFGRPGGAKLAPERRFRRPDRKKIFRFLRRSEAPTENFWIDTRWKGVTAGCETAGGIRNGGGALEVERHRKARTQTSENPKKNV